MPQERSDPTAFARMSPARNVPPSTRGAASAWEGPVAFVLAGGASHAAVQVGMLEALTDAGIRPDFVVGTSAGAVNSVAFGADPSPAGLSRLAAGWKRATRSQVFPSGPANWFWARLDAATTFWTTGAWPH